MSTNFFFVGKKTTYKSSFYLLTDFFQFLGPTPDIEHFILPFATPLRTFYFLQWCYVKVCYKRSNVWQSMVFKILGYFQFEIFCAFIVADSFPAYHQLFSQMQIYCISMVSHRCLPIIVNFRLQWSVAWLIIKSSKVYNKSWHSVIAQNDNVPKKNGGNGVIRSFSFRPCVSPKNWKKNLITDKKNCCRLFSCQLQIIRGTVVENYSLLSLKH